MKKRKMLKRITILYLGFWLVLTASAMAIWGQRGDIMATEAPLSAISMNIMIMQCQLRAMNEQLLTMGVPQYQFGHPTGDLQLLKRNFIFHIEIAPFDCEYTDWEEGSYWHGFTWHRYRFTPFGKSMLDPHHAADIYEWIGSRQGRYRLPFDEIHDVYQKFCNGDFQLGNIPLIMIGSEYGQTVEDYTNFADFFGAFMDKHYYCITAVNWALYKAVYDKCLYMRQIYEESFKDPQVVQVFDTLTAARLLWFLVKIGFIEEY